MRRGYWTDKTFSDEHIKKLSESHKGQKPNSGSFKKGCISSFKGKTHSEESKKKNSESHKGRNPWNKGIPRSEEVKKKISKSKKGQISWLKGKHHTNETKLKLSKSKTIYTKEERIIRDFESDKRSLEKYGFPFKMDWKSYTWALSKWSKTIKNQFKNKCRVCGGVAEISHHLIYKSTECKLSLNINNGIALCKPCHAEVHGWNFSK